MRGIRIKINDYNDFENLCLNLNKVGDGIFWNTFHISEIHAYETNDNYKIILLNKLEISNKILSEMHGINQDVKKMYSFLKNYTFDKVYNDYNNCVHSNHNRDWCYDFSVKYEIKNGKRKSLLDKTGCRTSIKENTNSIKFWNESNNAKLYSNFSTMYIEFPVDLNHSGFQEYSFRINTDKNHNIYLEGIYLNDSFKNIDNKSNRNCDMSNKKPIEFINSIFEKLGFDSSKSVGLGRI